MRSALCLLLRRCVLCIPHLGGGALVQLRAEALDCCGEVGVSGAALVLELAEARRCSGENPLHLSERRAGALAQDKVTMTCGGGGDDGEGRGL